MTLEEAIRHCEEVAERYDRVENSHADDGLKQECIQCAADHRQLAEWLTELKELRGLVAASNVLAKDVLAVDTLCKKILEYKRLLSLAVEDFNKNICNVFSVCSICTENQKDPCETFKWRYTDEALKLIGGSKNG